MPGGPDKIIINNGGFTGRVSAIHCEFGVLQHLGQEIIDKGLAFSKESLDIRDEMTPECEKIDNALDEYLAYLRKLGKRMQVFIDSNP